MCPYSTCLVFHLFAILFISKSLLYLVRTAQGKRLSSRSLFTLLPLLDITCFIYFTQYASELMHDKTYTLLSCVWSICELSASIQRNIQVYSANAWTQQLPLFSDIFWAFYYGHMSIVLSKRLWKQVFFLSVSVSVLRQTEDKENSLIKMTFKTKRM